MGTTFDFEPFDKTLQRLPRPDNDKLADTQKELVKDYRAWIQREAEDLTAKRPEVKLSPLLMANVQVEVSSKSDPGPVALETQRHRPFEMLVRFFAARQLSTRVDRAAPYRRAYRVPPPGRGGYKRSPQIEEVVKQMIEDLGGLDRASLEAALAGEKR